MGRAVFAATLRSPVSAAQFSATRIRNRLRDDRDGPALVYRRNKLSLIAPAELGSKAWVFPRLVKSSW